MTTTATFAGRRTLVACLLAVLALIAHASCAGAQSAPSEAKPSTPVEPPEYRTFYLTNTAQQDDNDIVTDLRNMLPRARIYCVQTQGAITIRGTADEIQLAQRIIADIDRPAKTYRLTFTFNQTEAGKPSGTRRVSMLVVAGIKGQLKLGSKIPIEVGSPDAQKSSENTEVQYEDIGLDIEAWLDREGDALHLRTRVVESGVADEKSNVGVQDPILRQTLLDSDTALVDGKPMVLGSLDLPGGQRSEEIEVVAQPAR